MSEPAATTRAAGQVSGDGRPALRRAAWLGVWYAVAAGVSIAVSREGHGVANVWYANAVAMAFLATAPRREMAGLVAAMAVVCVAMNAAAGEPWAVAWRLLPPNVLEVVLGAALIRRLGLHLAEPQAARTLVQLLAAGALVPPAVAALLAGAMRADGQTAQSFLAVATVWFEGAAIGGVSALALALVACRIGAAALVRQWADPGILAYLMGTVALALLCLAHVPYPLVFISMLLVAAAALFNVAVVSVLVLAMSLCCTLALATGLWVTPPVTAYWQELWVYLGIAAALVPAQLLAATIAEVRAGHAELERRQAELARTNEALESFVRIASHDLREPLNTVVQFSTLIQIEASEGRPLGREPVAWLGHVVTAGERMRVLLDDLLRYLRAQHDLTPTDASGARQAVLALDGVLADACAALAGRLLETRADVRVEPLPMVLGDRNALVLLFQNLLSNALKFVPPGRVPRVRVRLGPRTGQGDDAVRIEVHDNGIGIAETELPRLFKPFARLVPRRHYEGTGLGLALARDIAVHHGGDITVRSQPGQGSMFVVQLRAAPAGVSAP